MSGWRGTVLASLLVAGVGCTSGSTEAASVPPTPATSSVTPSSSSASPIGSSAPGFRSLDACVGMKLHRCTNSTGYLAGDRPQIVATVRPAGIAAAAILWRRDGNSPWERIARVPFDDEGRAAWHWATSDADIRGGPWRFKYVLPGLGASDVVRVKVFAPDF